MKHKGRAQELRKELKYKGNCIKSIFITFNSDEWDFSYSKTFGAQKMNKNCEA